MSDKRFSYEALNKIRPGAKWECFANDWENLVWKDDKQTKPTWDELSLATEVYIQELNSKLIATEYQRQRAAEYPPIGDQLDALWKGGDAAAEMLAKVQAVKAKYPKPE